jgi:hypothetical protein
MKKLSVFLLLTAQTASFIQFPELTPTIGQIKSN